jgi:hypothetical protein
MVLSENIEDVAILIGIPPEVLLCIVDSEKDFV